MKNLKNALKRSLSALMVLTMLLMLIPFGTLQVSAVSAPANASDISQRMENIITGKYGEDKYFTTNGTACSGHNKCKTPTAAEAGEAGGSQCFGYARYVFYQLFGHSMSTTYYASKRYVLGDTRNVNLIGQTTTSSGTETKSILSKAYIGDIIQASRTATAGEHTMVVYSVNANKITVLDCNHSPHSNCGIGLRTVSWSDFSAEFKCFSLYRSKRHPGINNVLTIQYNANGGIISGSDIMNDKYKVSETVGVNMRSNAGTNYEVILTIPQNATFVVTKTKTANGYVWGETTYEGENGWCVISEDWTTKIGTQAATPYYLNSEGTIIKTSSNKEASSNWEEGQGHENGLYNCGTFQISKEGYSFIGWSITKTGELIFNQDDNTLKAEDIQSDVKNGSTTVILYAIWQANSPSSIEIQNIPNKVEYEIGDNLDTSGLELKAIYDDGTTEAITSGFVVSGFDSSTAGIQTVTVSYEGLNATFSVTVNEKKVESNFKVNIGTEKSAVCVNGTVEILLTPDDFIFSENLCSFDCPELYFDTNALEFIGATVNDSNFSVGANEYESGCLAIIVTDDSLSGASFGEGEIQVILEFKALTEGETAISLKGDKVISGTIADDKLSTCIGAAGDDLKIEITAVTEGDVNGDGLINSTDFMWVRRCYLGLFTLTDQQKEAADTNNDGLVNSTDFMQIRRHFLGLYTIQ